MSIWNFWRRRPPFVPLPASDYNVEFEFRKLVLIEFTRLNRKMERLMSATDDLKASGAAIDARMDALGDLVGTGATAILAAITAIVAGQNPDGSVPADVASAVVADMQVHLAAVEAKVAALGPAVVALDAAVHPPLAASAAPLT